MQEFFTKQKSVAYFFTQRRLRLLVELCKQIDMTSIFSAMPYSWRRIQPIRAVTTCNQWLRHCGTAQFIA